MMERRDKSILKWFGYMERVDVRRLIKRIQGVGVDGVSGRIWSLLNIGVRVFNRVKGELEPGMVEKRLRVK